MCYVIFCSLFTVLAAPIAHRVMVTLLSNVRNNNEPTLDGIEDKNGKI